MLKKTLIITAIIVAVIALGVTALYIAKRQVGKEAKKPEGTATGLGKRIVYPKDTVAIDTSDWKIYRNEKYGFEVRYPNNWQISPYSDDEEQIFFPKGGFDPYSLKAFNDEYWITLVRIVAIAGVKDKPAEEVIKAILEKNKNNVQKEEVLHLPNVSISVFKRVEVNTLDGRLELSVFIPNKARPNMILHFTAPYEQRTQKELQEAEAIFDAIVQSIRFLE
jgi:hypothetical protein